MDFDSPSKTYEVNEGTVVHSSPQTRNLLLVSLCVGGIILVILLIVLIVLMSKSSQTSTFSSTGHLFPHPIVLRPGSPYIPKKF
jgi:uncharacterized integral membrane protein